MNQSNIPLEKLENGLFRQFLQTGCNTPIPEESIIRKNHVNSFQETYEETKQRIGSSYIWFAFDETTDSCGRYVAN